MSIAIHNNDETRPGQLGVLRIAIALVFASVYIWLRVGSSLWNNRWTGFSLGAAFLLIFLVLQRMETVDIKSKATYLTWSIFFLGIGLWALSIFFLGGNSTDAFLGFMMLSFGVHNVKLYRWVATQDRQVQHHG
jgi:hypothetical protein